MDAKELRIGNWVDTPNPNMNTFIIKSIDESKVGGYNNFGSFVYWRIEDIKPITINEERLIRFGFEIDRWVSILKMPDYEASLQIWVGNNSVSICRSGIAAYHSTCLYLHQIQNLYFDLTGEELKTIPKAP